MQCPQSAGDTNCPSSLYSNWDEIIWDFGTSDQYPALIFDGIATRDSDNDGVWNDSDAFPDNDAASVDADNDGLPDAWNSSCDTDCQINSGLTLDTELVIKDSSASGSSTGAGGGLISPFMLMILTSLMGLYRRRFQRPESF
jgi:hypothetical protein